ncbi:WD40-repeat-containing domain protein [Gigaspora rosea]|uniref:WD repeat-containing protein n=1 Tax=Gigaspora rosea TaxID=44941 RepID=A0A397U5E5_9GLOM|nr:WD40-repeat-containing domain protein [Gigaspora rosea]
MRKSQILQPNPLEFDNQVFDLAFHPQQNIIASGLITGEIFCHRYSCETDAESINLLSIRPHKKSCRGLEFSYDGTALFSVSKDKSIQVIDLETGKVLTKKRGAHDKPINCVLRLNENSLTTGDDDGCIKIWDTRTGNQLMEYSDHEDFISDFSFRDDIKTLISTSGDGTLSIYDIRKPNLLAMSDNQDDELLSVTVVKNGRKVITGTQGGVINLFSWGEWGDSNDRFVGHPNSVDTIVKITEDLVCTGSSDGIIRIIEILPNKFYGVIGDHGDFPIECIRISFDNTFLASCSHDNVVKFWDIRYLYDDKTDDHNDETDTNMEYIESDTNYNNKGKGKSIAAIGQSNNFFADL